MLLVFDHMVPHMELVTAASPFVTTSVTQIRKRYPGVYNGCVRQNLLSKVTESATGENTCAGPSGTVWSPPSGVPTALKDLPSPRVQQELETLSVPRCC